MRKAILIQSLFLDSASGSQDPVAEIANPGNTVTLQAPGNLKPTRITIQLQNLDYTTLGKYVLLLISTTPPQNTNDGYLLLSKTDVVNEPGYPANFTFETFDNNGGIETTLYLSNVSNFKIGVTVIYEGYYID